jgi:SAM-dependent methyltransferase
MTVQNARPFQFAPESLQDAPLRYEEYLVPTVFGPYAERLVALADPKVGERVLDVACGTGIVARHAAPRVGPTGHVVGIDLIPAMVEVARSAAEGLRPPIEWHVGDVSTLPFPDAAFDVAFCQQGLQFFPDRAAALKELHRTLAPGGRLALSVWRPIRYLPIWLHIATALERHGCPDAGAFVRRALPDLTAAELRALVTDIGFEAVHLRIDIGTVRFPSVPELFRQYTSAIPVRDSLDALSTEEYDATVRDFGAAIREYTDDEGVVAPVEAHVVQARR